MAFEILDFNRLYIPKGDFKGLFNACRTDMTSLVEQYYAFFNEAGSYIIQQMTTSSTTALKVYKYYARGKKPTLFAADWVGRAGLSYVEYYQLFEQD